VDRTPREARLSADPPPGDSADGVPPPGSLIAGKFRVEKLLGKGGMGFVVAARHMTLGEQVGVPTSAPDADYRLPRPADPGPAGDRRARRTAARLRGA
jgi:hypothetical protein